MTPDQLSQYQAELAKWQLYLGELQAVIGLGSLIFLAIYVWKTAQIADETRRAAIATQTAAEATQVEAQSTRAASETALAQLAEMRKTREGATDAAGKQLAELASQRLAAITPYVRVVRVQINSQEPNLMDLSIHVSVQNVGAGPALSARIVADHPWMTFPKTSPMIDVPPGEPSDRLLHPTSVEQVSIHPLPQNMPTIISLKIEYRDLAERWWETTVSVRFSWVLEGVNTYRLNELQPSLLDDQSEKVRQIGRPTITQ